MTLLGSDGYFVMPLLGYDFDLVSVRSFDINYFDLVFGLDFDQILNFHQ